MGAQDDIVHPIEAFLTRFHPGLDGEQVLATVLAARFDARAIEDAPAQTLERLRAFAHRETEHFRGTALEHSVLSEAAHEDGVVVSRAVHDLVARAGLRFDTVPIGPPQDGATNAYRVDAGSVLMPGRVLG